MTVPGSRWHPLGEPASDAEAAGLNGLRKILPDAPTTHAWVNVTFRDRQGRASEIDVILLNDNGFYVVELKGWHGWISGDQQTWRVTAPNGNVRIEKDPYILNDNKAKRLGSELKSIAKGVGIPFLRAITVMHGNGSTFDLPDASRATTFALDGFNITGLEPVSTVFDAAPRDLRDHVDAHRAEQVIGVLAKVGLTPRPKNRMIGQYQVAGAEQLGEGAGWVDVVAVHPVMKNQRRRVRLYDVPPKASAEQRREIEQSAYREMALGQQLDHPGIVRPIEIMTPDTGPALLFPDDAGSTPLLQYLEAHDLTADARRSIIRQLAEVLDYAHKRGVQHRGLTPASIHVRDEANGPRVLVRDWQTGRRDSQSTMQSTLYSGATGIRDLVAADGLVYLAPESNQADPDGTALDVYGLGALAYLILTDAPPAASEQELRERLHDGLDPAADRDGLPPELCDVVRHATVGDVVERTPSVAEFLDQLNAAGAAQTDDEPEPAKDPRDAEVGEEIAERWIVAARLGSGASGVALLVDDVDREEEGIVLKLANSEDSGDRLRAEAAALRDLDHPRIVRLLDGPLDVQDHVGLLLADAGRPTLGRRLLDEGRLTLEQLENYGRDLFEAAAYLESRSVFHRDIKPDNLGVRENPGDRSRHLVLFDFSLTSEPLDRVRSGTRGYMDPFLGTGRRQRYDSAAERFAVAATLFEMATGSKPVWGDGQSDPAQISDPVHLAPGMFDPEVADAMVAFFGRALARDAVDRFDDTATMAAAWAAVFPSAAVSVSQEATPREREALMAAATLDTPLLQAGLTARATSAARRLQAETVQGLIDLAPFALNNTPGIGVHVRSELQRARRAWKERLQVTSSVETAATQLLRGIEQAQSNLVPAPRSRAADATALARRLLNLTDAEPAWPNLVTAAEDSGEGDQLVTHMSALVDFWGKSQTATQIRDEVAGALTALGGVATVAELADRLVALRGSSAEGPDRRRHALGVIRAAVEGDAGATFLSLRNDPAVLLTFSADEAADERVEAVAAISATLDEAVAGVAGSLGPNVGLNLVRTHPRAEAVGIADPQRLLAVAARASSTAAVSPRNELYPRGMAPGEAVRAIVAAAPGRISADRLRSLAVTRFPAAQPVPGRPALDPLVHAADPGLSWDPTMNAYSRAAGSSASLLSTGTVYAPVIPTTRFDEIDEALSAALASRAATVVTAPPAQLAQVPARLVDRYEVTVVDVTAALINAMRSTAEAAGVDWHRVLTADADAAGGTQRRNLERLVSDATDDFWPRILADDRPLLLTELAPLTRYGQLDRLATLLDTATPRPAARFLLVPKRAGAAAPTLDGAAIPTSRGTWIDLPDPVKEPA